MSWPHNIYLARQIHTAREHAYHVASAAQTDIKPYGFFSELIKILPCSIQNVMGAHSHVIQPLICIFAAVIVVATAVYIADEFYPSEEKCFRNQWNAKSRCEIYQLLDDIQKVFASVGVRQHVCFGTLLGVVRHNDLIPWDDDIDIAYIDADEAKLPEVFTKLSKDYNVSCITVREGLVGAPYYRFYRDTSEKIPFGQGRWPYVDLFRTHLTYDNNANKAFIAPPGRSSFASNTVLPLRKAKFGPIYVNTPHQPFAHLNSEFGKAHGPNGYMNTAVGTSFHHRTQMPSLCSSISTPFKKSLE